MKKLFQNNIGLFISITVIALVIAIIWSGILSLTPPDRNEAEKLLKTDSELLEIVVQYLKKSERQNFYLHKSTEYDEINDQTTKKAVEQLFKHNYVAIGRNGNTIYFLRWTRWKDFGAGLIYSINAETEPTIDYLSSLEPLSKAHWYYYEEN